MGIVLNPELFTEGIMINDETVKVADAKFAMFDYGGKAAVAAPALIFTLERATGEKVDQSFTVGRAEDWRPSENGKELIPIGSKTNIAKGSNAGLFLVSLINAGFPTNKITSDVSCFIGMEAHMVQVPAPKRPGLSVKENATVLTVVKILKMPWESGTTMGVNGNGAATTAPPSVNNDEALKTETIAIITELLSKQESIAKVSLLKTAVSALTGNPKANEIARLIFDDTFLSQGPWNYAGGVLSRRA